MESAKARETLRTPAWWKDWRLEKAEGWGVALHGRQCHNGTGGLREQRGGLLFCHTASVFSEYEIRSSAVRTGEERRFEKMGEGIK